MEISMVNAPDKQELINRQKELLAKVDKLEADLAQPKSADFEEQATERENDDVLRNLIIDTKVEIQQITHTLTSIEEGRYGECESCGKTISPERLKTLPYATLCIDCATAAE
jgi:DnaK suppressor protein